MSLKKRIKKRVRALYEKGQGVVKGIVGLTPLGAAYDLFRGLKGGSGESDAVVFPSGFGEERETMTGAGEASLSYKTKRPRLL